MGSSIYNPETAAKGIWERGTFTVPEDIPDVRVQDVAYKYLRRFGEALERQDFEVLEIIGPVVSGGMMRAEPGRKRYDCFARVRRKPVTVTIEIPEKLIPEMQTKGLKLK